MSCRKASKGVKPIKAVYGRNIFDSRGIPTVEVDLVTDLGLFRASVPSGASTGDYEAVEIRDGVAKDYHGKGVFKAIDYVNNVIGPELCKQEMDVTQQEKIDQFLIDLDGTADKSKFGTNAILGISLAVCKAGAAKRGLPLYRHIADLAGIKDLVMPVPAFNVINGGAHTGTKLAMQGFMILPTGATSFAEAMKMGTETYHHLRALVKEQYQMDSVGDEGGFAPNISDAKDALNLLTTAIANAGYVGRIEIAIDAAGTQLFKEGLYDLDFKNPSSNKGKWMKPEELFNLYKSYIDSYPIASIQDPFEQDDFDAWTNMTKQVQIQIVGDDLTVTNAKRIQKAVDSSACNCLLLMLNQIGTITESIKAHLLAKSNGWGTMVSTRSGETEDTFIADLVVGLSTGQIKAGAPCRSERLAKYNQILRIEEELARDTRYAGKAFRKPI
ncbi:unnamed protein product [Psylliodes chrysocephalus]|uniref:Enolase n=1 Tax=Psylliodes chrysocephalus TaxID=3402493 RepID=A0A9P0D6B8_9CUCU|nr:unnamed protein product [Psylliodes chrysocephala]